MGSVSFCDNVGCNRAEEPSAIAVEAEIPEPRMLLVKKLSFHYCLKSVFLPQVSFAGRKVELQL